MIREIKFLSAIWKANLSSVMEYRASFISQVIGMMLNDGVYFLFWVIFFNRFKEVRGWELSDMFLLFGLVACGYGFGVVLFGNALSLAEVISAGKLDYYLSMPRPVLLHVLASRSITSGIGDALYGITSFFFAQQYSLDGFVRFLLGSFLSMIIFLSFLTFVQSLAFWMGNAQNLSNQAINAIITFSVYPITLFDNTAKLLLLTLIPAAFVGALPAEFVRTFSWDRLFLLLGVTALFLSLAIAAFYRGLRRYESGSGIQIQGL